MVTQRKFLRVQVKNEGKRIATNCKGSITLINCRNGCTGPSRDRKTLRWEPGVVQQTLPPKGGEEMLDVVFSDSTPFVHPGITCGVSQNPQGATFHAYMSTTDSVGVFPARGGDAFCEGNFEIEILVRCDEGYHAAARFLVHVSSNYLALSMERVS